MEDCIEIEWTLPKTFYEYKKYQAKTPGQGQIWKSNLLTEA